MEDQVNCEKKHDDVFRDFHDVDLARSARRLLAQKQPSTFFHRFPRSRLHRFSKTKSAEICEWSEWDARHRRQSRKGKRRASLGNERVSNLWMFCRFPP